MQRFAAFRRLYLDADVKPLWEELTRRVGPGVRLNIMVAERAAGTGSSASASGSSTPRQRPDAARPMYLDMRLDMSIASA